MPIGDAVPLTDPAQAVTDVAETVVGAVVPDSWWGSIVKFFYYSDLGRFVGKVLLITITILVTMIAVKLINRAFNQMIAKMKQSNQSGATLAAFLRYPILFIVYFSAIAVIVSGIPMLNDAVTKLMAAGGVLAVVFGVASQEALGSVASGIMILVFKPFVIGDVVNVISQGVTGTVEDITLRHTVLRTIENKRIIVPNSTMNTSIVENADYGDKNVCLTMDVGITYESDLDRALALLAEVVGEHPDYLDRRTPEEQDKGNPKVVVRVSELADSAVILRALLWGKDNATTFAMRADLLRHIKKRFDKEGIDLAYPHLVVVSK
ncbi:MAG: mechanosensitive ion channel family protein [Butyricicoccus pullicaecorum]|nr:mechanosensitive ion channel family protein [Butyricicoccus pullicaecorum]